MGLAILDKPAMFWGHVLCGYLGFAVGNDLRTARLSSGLKGHAAVLNYQALHVLYGFTFYASDW